MRISVAMTRAESLFAAMVLALTCASCGSSSDAGDDADAGGLSGDTGVGPSSDASARPSPDSGDDGSVTPGRDSGPRTPATPADCEAESSGHPYFASLIARPEVAYCFSLRSQANIDGIDTGAESDRRMPVVYDAEVDAALFSIDPSGASPSSGSTDTQQKHPYIPTNHTSMLITWDLRVGESMRWVESEPYGHLGQHKAFRIDGPGAAAWLTAKLNYPAGTRTGEGVAQLFMTCPSPRWHVPEQSWEGPSETLMPKLADFYVQPDTWTRYWWFIEGTMGGGEGGEVVYVSSWAADETRDPVHLYDRVPVYSPSDGIDVFRLEYDSSQDQADNDYGENWNRNFVVLHGLSLEDVRGLLERP